MKLPCVRTGAIMINAVHETGYAVYLPRTYNNRSELNTLEEISTPVININEFNCIISQLL